MIGHHLERPSDALREALRLAQVVIIIEPNGYNPGLKILEKTSPYDLGHEEKSYAPRTLNRWITTLGGLVTQRQWIGLVPMFCPDWMARTLKLLEPVVECLPVIKRVCCAQYFCVARRNLQLSCVMSGSKASKSLRRFPIRFAGTPNQKVHSGMFLRT